MNKSLAIRLIRMALTLEGMIDGYELSQFE